MMNSLIISQLNSTHVESKDKYLQLIELTHP